MIIEGSHKVLGKGIFISDIQQNSLAFKVSEIRGVTKHFFFKNLLKRPKVFAIKLKMSCISLAAVRPLIPPLWSETILHLNVEVWFLTMLNIKIFKDYMPNFSSIIQTYRPFKIHAYISLEGRTAAAEMLLILKLL